MEIQYISYYTYLKDNYRAVKNNTNMFRQNITVWARNYKLFKSHVSKFVAIWFLSVF